MSYVQERYNPQTVPANSSVLVNSNAIGGFVAITGGTISFTKANGSVLFSGVPVTAGVWLPLPFGVGAHGGTFTTAGNASGILAVG